MMRAYEFKAAREMTPAERRAQRDMVMRSEGAERATAKIRKGHGRRYTPGMLGAIGDRR